MSPGEFKGLGPKSRAMLARAGITREEQLRKVGSVAAYLAVQQTGAKPSLNLLWGLESVITGLHWREVAQSSRTALLLELDERKSQAPR